MILEVTLAQLPNICEQLAQKIKEIQFTPQAILAIERAGRLVAFNLQRHFDIPIISVYVTRPGTNQKHKYSSILRVLPKGVRSCLRLIELHSGYHRLNSNREVQFSFELPPINSRLLIVDDAIDTGNTIKAIMDFLLVQGFSRDSLKIAVINTTLKKPLVEPDVFLIKKLCAYPWSADSQELDLFKNEYKRAGEYIEYKQR